MKKNHILFNNRNEANKEEKKVCVRQIQKLKKQEDYIKS